MSMLSAVADKPLALAPEVEVRRRAATLVARTAAVLSAERGMLDRVQVVRAGVSALVGNVAMALAPAPLRR